MIFEMVELFFLFFLPWLYYSDKREEREQQQRWHVDRGPWTLHSLSLAPQRFFAHRVELPGLVGRRARERNNGSSDPVRACTDHEMENGTSPAWIRNEFVRVDTVRAGRLVPAKDKRARSDQDQTPRQNCRGCFFFFWRFCLLVPVT